MTRMVFSTFLYRAFTARIRQDIRGQGQTTPGEHRHQPLAAKRTDQAIEGHGREMPDHRTELQTEAAVSGQQSIAGDLRAHLAVTQDEVRQDREHRLARRALDTPDGDPTQTDAHIMRVARQAPSPATRRLM